MEQQVGGLLGGALVNANGQVVNNAQVVNLHNNEQAAGNPAIAAQQAAAAAAPHIPSRLRLERQCLSWSKVPVSPKSTVVPPPRSGAASVVVGGKLYVFGGYGGGTGRLDDFYSFDFETRMWEEVQVLSVEKPGCRENNGVVISDSSDSIYLFGGYDGGNWLNDLWKFDIESKRWTCIQESSDAGPADEASSLMGGGGAGAGDLNRQQQPPLVATAAAAAAVAAGGGGGSAQSPSRQVRGKVPSRRFGYVSVVHAGKLIVWAGFDGSRWLNCMYVFDFATKTWSEIQANGLLPSVRSCPAWAKDETHVYIQGGYDGVERKSDFFACDLSTYTWTQMPSFGTPPSPRYFHSCCLYGNKMYVYGGYSGNERLDDMYAYDFETNHWSEVNCTSGDAPSGRSSLVAQVYENCLYIFGGYNGTMVLNDFHKFRLKPVGMPPPSLVSDFRRLINNAELADVRFVVEEKDVYAHRAILACRSEYFRVMLLTGGMRESRDVVDAKPPGTQDSPIHLQDVSYPVFLQVLEFLYTDTVCNVSLETGIHLMIASERFMLDRLKSLCEDVIRRDIDLENCIGILVASHRHHAGNLKEIALEYILAHLSNPTIRNGLTDLKPEPDLLVEILQRTTAGEGASVAGNGHINVAGGGRRTGGMLLDDSRRHDQFGAGAGWANARR